MTEWIDACDLAELPAGETRLVDAGGLSVALVNVRGALHAVEDRCSHDGSPLFGCGLETEDLLYGAEIICPRHGARFCLNTGAALTPPAYESLAVFPTRVEHGRIQIDIDP